MKYNLEKKILALFLIGFMVVGFIGSRSFLQIGPLIKSVATEIRNGGRTEKKTKKNEELTGMTGSDQKTDEEEMGFSEFSGQFSDTLFFKEQMVDRNGAVAKQLGLTERYNQDNMYVLDNGYIIGVYDYTSTDYETEQVTGFRDFLQSRGISLLYVNEPVKYTDDAAISEILGIGTYPNDNADRLLARLEEAGVETLDLRKTLPGDDPFGWFYKTDHHWTAETGKNAARCIAEKLNADLGYSIDLSNYADENLVSTFYSQSWLGEQGRKLGETYAGLEDYTLITPAYDTSFTITINDAVLVGSFDEVLVNQAVLYPENNEDIYNAPSWHYAYHGNDGPIINNWNDGGKKILVLGDSFDAVTNAFLAIGVSEVEGIIMRDYQGSIRDYIMEKDFDTVVIAYTEFMIGAHDDEESANYRIFDLE